MKGEISGLKQEISKMNAQMTEIKNLLTKSTIVVDKK
jgi:hypothetical protein